MKNQFLKSFQYLGESNTTFLPSIAIRRKHSVAYRKVILVSARLPITFSSKLCSPRQTSTSPRTFEPSYLFEYTNSHPLLTKLNTHSTFPSLRTSNFHEKHPTSETPATAIFLSTPSSFPLLLSSPSTATLRLRRRLRVRRWTVDHTQGTTDEKDHA